MSLRLFVAIVVSFTLQPMRVVAENLVRDGDFVSLASWRANDHLARNGKVSRVPAERGVTLENPAIDLDASLFQEIPTGGHAWLGWSVRIKPGVLMRASLGLVALDAEGRVLAIETPTRVQGTRWNALEGTMRMPAGATALRVVLTVLDGKCTFADVRVSPAETPQRVMPRTRLAAGEGFAVKAHTIERPFWEMFADDLDGDGKPELIGCDVDGVVTVRREGELPTLRFDAGALVYQFATADLDGDGTKEILFSSVDPKQPVRVLTVPGAKVRTFGGSGGLERVATGDLDGDGRPEVALSLDNNVAGSGIAAGLAVYDRTGRQLWEKRRPLRNFVFADWVKGGGRELIVGGTNGEFEVYDRAGERVAAFAINGGLLEQFAVADVNGDGKLEVVALMAAGPRFTLTCHDGARSLWQTPVNVSTRASGTGGSAVIATGDFDRKVSGLETVVVGLHIVSVIDATGALVYQSRDGREGEYWETWMPGGINSPGLACWAGPEPRLFLSSSRFRDPAYYRLSYGGRDELREFKVPDQEKHLEALHAAVKRRPALPARSAEKIKVFMAGAEYGQASERALREYAAALKALESPALEHLVMYEASDLLGHERGQKMTTDQIVARAALLEKVGIPFGYFATHGGQVWLSREAIRRSKEAAPRMFRFLYIAENLETLYGPLYKDVLRWTDEALDFCAAHGMKMIFKEKHDVWGLLPADSEVFDVLFSPKHRDVTVPIWATNQPYQPEIQLGGMIGLKAAGLCREFGMSTQYWNWHEWGRYPRGIRDVSPTYVCPADIILRLELMGVALGGTWVHVEGGQTYLRTDPRDGVAPLALRHRDLVYEMVRKNLFEPGTLPANLNATALVRSFHPALEEGKARQRKVAYPYYERNQPALRQGFIPARFLFEPYAADAFPWLAYREDWNVRTCFPQTPLGWVPVLPPSTPLPDGWSAIRTDGEKVRLEGDWQESGSASAGVTRCLERGAAAIPLRAPGASVVLQRGPGGACIALLMDPGYLAPRGVTTALETSGRVIRRATDLITGGAIAPKDGRWSVVIAPGAFRLVQVEFD